MNDYCATAATPGYNKYYFSSLQPHPCTASGRFQDFGRVLPDSGTHFMYALEQYGMLILLLLIVTGMASRIFLPIAGFLYGLLNALVFLI